MLEVAVRKQFDGFRLDVAFAVAKGTTVLFGPSGSGKSLTLQTIAGVVRPQAGRIVINSQAVYDSRLQIDLPPQQRQIGYVPQHYALFPHLTLAKNIRFGVLGLSRREQEQRVREMVELCGLHGLEHRYPRELSGGQQQRVALARALAVRPQLLLLDEPFAALDAPLRATLRQELVQLQARLDISILLVTHDLGDAFALGQQLIVYDEGQVIQQGSRDQVFFRPATRHVAEFVGTGNILPAVVERADEDTLWLRWRGRILATAPLPLASGTGVDLCIRPTQILLVRSDRVTERLRENLFSGRIVNEVMEAETYTLFLRVDGSEADYDLVISLPGYVYHRLSLDTEKYVTVELRRQAVHVIPRATDQKQGRWEDESGLQPRPK